MEYAGQIITREDLKDLDPDTLLLDDPDETTLYTVREALEGLDMSFPAVVLVTGSNAILFREILRN